MTCVQYHQKAAGAEGIENVVAFTLGDVGADKFHFPGQAPLLLTSPVLHVVWAKPGSEVGQYGDLPVPTGYDPATGAPIWPQAVSGSKKPIRYDPETGAAIYEELAPAPPAEVTNANLARVAA